MPGDALDEAREMLSTKGMLLTQPIPSSVGPYRRELLETRRVLAALVAELEAARAVVEKSREVVRQQLGEDLSWWWNREMRQAPSSSVTVAALAAADALNAYDAVKAGKAAE